MFNWQRFTDGARDVILLAREEAHALKHDEIGVEHLLIGLLRQQHGLAARALRSFDLSSDRVRALAVESVAAGDGLPPGELSFTQDALEVLFHRSLVEALHRDGYIATEHILLGLVHEDDAPGARVLREVGLDREWVRAEVLNLMAPLPTRRVPEPPPARIDPELLARFTDAAKEVIVLAEDEARDLQHARVCTEHLLLALLRVGDGVAARVLESCGITLARVRERIASGRVLGQPWSGGAREGELPMSELAMRAVMRAAAKPQPGEEIDTEHILLGIIGVHESFGSRVLIDLGVYLEGIRDVVEQTGETGQPPPDAAQLAKTPPGLPLKRHVTWGFMQATTEAHHTAQMRGDTHVDLHDLVIGALLVDEGWPTGKGARDRLLEGTWPFAGPLLREIEDQLDRPLDAGDLLVLLASIPGGIAATALSSLGVDTDALAEAVQEARRGGARSELLWPAELVARSDEARAAPEPPTELERLAERVDQGREQFEQARTRSEQGRDELLEALRRVLGLRSG